MGDADKLKITVDRETCIGDGLCCNDAPETFEMDDDQLAIVKEPRATIARPSSRPPTVAPSSPSRWWTPRPASSSTRKTINPAFKPGPLERRPFPPETDTRRSRGRLAQTRLPRSD